MQVIFRRIFNYLLITGIAAGLLYVYYTYFLFDAPTSAAVVDVEEFGQPFAVIDIPGKGKGAIATRNIAVRVFALVCLGFSLQLAEGRTHPQGAAVVRRATPRYIRNIPCCTFGRIVADSGYSTRLPRRVAALALGGPVLPAAREVLQLVVRPDANEPPSRHARVQRGPRSSHLPDKLYCRWRRQYGDIPEDGEA